MDQPRVVAFVIQNNAGKRLLARYYDAPAFPTESSRQELEEQLHRKVAATTAGRGGAAVAPLSDLGAGAPWGASWNGDDVEVVLLPGGYTALAKPSADVWLAVVARSEENELVFAQVLNTVYSALSALADEVRELRILRHYEAALLVLDEVLDDSGVVLETDPVEVQERLAPVIARPVNLAEQSLSEALQNATASVTRSLLK
ncbi:hypothetical protein CDCA_CDCA16G4269 [Cyanidium caldarium]|uniref:Coatomer subunit zeta n=1 Tax=Cyanidium caldarium TaxID=2771 RepID=A0AAV9J164_CYACA|nr:hypothetical protein CDCA_CDCA16G4269 [Cyanidium caldarium]